MEKNTAKKLKKAAVFTGLALGTAYAVMWHIAKKQYPKSVYADKPEEQKPMQGRNVTVSENKESKNHNFSQKSPLFRYRLYTPVTVQKTGL